MKTTIENKKGKITYSKLMVTSEEAGNIAHNLGFDEEGRDWYVYNIAFFREKIAKRFDDEQLKYYHRTYTERIPRDPVTGRESHEVTRSKMLNYVFVLATETEVASFAGKYSINPVYRYRAKIEPVFQKHGISQWQTIPKSQMHSLMLIVEGYVKQVDFCTPTEQMLEKGAEVLVTEGRFAGVQGKLITNQGSRKGGCVYVRIDGKRSVRTSKVPEEHIQVLRLGKDPNFFYRKVRAFEAVLDECIERKMKSEPLLPEQRAHLEFFLFRYARLEGLTMVNAAKLSACRYVAYILLGKRKEATQELQRFENEATSTREGRKNLKRSPSALNYINNWKRKVEKVTISK